ncbi:MAG TPA: hypothetical protein VFS50_02550 [Meiothermus sp.]|nr:hypothetical protein [Meiothermus sp.]
MLTWLDLLSLLTLALAIAVGVRQGLPFMIGVLVATLGYAVVALILPSATVPVAVLVVIALLAGFGGAYLAGSLSLPRLSPLLEGLAGSAGGLVWGILLALAIWVSFPAEFVASSGTLRYPSARLPLTIQRGVTESPFANNLFNWANGQPVMRKILLPHLR